MVFARGNILPPAGILAADLLVCNRLGDRAGIDRGPMAPLRSFISMEPEVPVSNVSMDRRERVLSGRYADERNYRSGGKNLRPGFDGHNHLVFLLAGLKLFKIPGRRELPGRVLRRLWTRIDAAPGSLIF